MKPPNVPGWKTARAIWETTESVALGSAWTCTARYETPRNIVIVERPEHGERLRGVLPLRDAGRR